MFTFDTIVAIATPIEEGAIGMIRLSGEKAIHISNRLFLEKDLTQVKSHTLHYGHLVRPDNGKIIDEIMIAVMHAPKTFTREDVVEIHCHGGIRVIQSVLNLILEQDGVRLAEPGEFTKRAFLNGRIDLSQAEAVIDLIRSKTDAASEVALNQLEGKLSEKVRALRQKILDILAHIEVNIDYPEYDDVHEMTTQEILPRVQEIEKNIHEILSHAKTGKIMREGLKVAIVGRPNVGKSSLLNAFVRESKAIVTEIAGTTRDIIEEYINIQGIPVHLIDTAGIRQTEDIVEKIGVERSQQAIEQADLILFLLNISEPLTVLDEQILPFIQDKTTLVVLNKNDLPQKISQKEIQEKIGSFPYVYISAQKQIGMEDLEKQMVKLILQDDIGKRNDVYLSNARHIQLLNLALNHIQEIYSGIQADMPIDLIQIDLTEAWSHLGEIIGENASDDLINQLFSQFCLGK